MNEVFHMLESLSSDKGLYSKEKVAWWLLKYEKEYYSQLRFFETLSINYKSPRNLTKYTKESQFLELYEILNKVMGFCNEEAYYKDQLDVYDSVKNNVEQSKKWFEIHKTDRKHKYSEFECLFQDTSTPCGFNFEVGFPLSVKFKKSEFQYTLKFLEIIEMSSKVEIIGVVEIINVLEFIKLNEHHVYNRKTIVVYVDDFNDSKLLVRFVKGKIGLLDNVKVGQKIKVYADLTGGENEFDKLGYSLSLLGWKIEILN
ncbi:DUF3127 domain-containing protein [Formosa sp. L2A11]|uniref:DUF3127 domain-containing protein n=1 Tax=Formosa sp. L2A11 TaxID=2686363 RepID=UPI00131B9F43|nr:DUF3127 domain-containing protein [Formosa sp. L2A11]